MKGYGGVGEHMGAYWSIREHMVAAAAAAAAAAASADAAAAASGRSVLACKLLCAFRA